MCQLIVFWSSRKTCMIFCLFRNLSGTSFTLHHLLLSLKVVKWLVLLFTQNGPRQSDFHRTLSRHLELCVLFILDCPDFALLSGEMLQQPLVTQGQMISQRAKLSNGLSSNEWGNYKRTRQGALAALLLYIYYLQVVCATTICLPHVHLLCFYLMSSYSSTCVFFKTTMLPTYALISYL